MKKYLSWLMPMLAVLIIAGCNTQKRDIAKLHRLNYLYPNELSVDCAKLFPAKDSVGKVIKSDNHDYSVMIDSLQLLYNGLIDELLNPNPVALFNNKADSIKYLQSTATLKNIIADLKNKIDALKAAYKPCKPDTIPRYITDMALVNVWKTKAVNSADSLIKVKTQLDSEKKSNSKKTWWIVALASLIGLTIIYKVVTFIYGGYLNKAKGLLK